MTNHKPATALPWKLCGTNLDEFGSLDLNTGDYAGGGYTPQDAAFIVHAANAYPKLVEALKALVEAVNDPDADSLYELAAAGSLLRSLGEEA